jgi:acetolactate synthase-1/2/3 large subunit
LVDATLGPGATNLVTGLVEALNAGTAMVAIVGDSHRMHSWKNMTQESRQTDILRPACKDLIRIEHVERIPELMRRAFAVATTGRPGPVVVDVPEDVCHATCPFEEGAFAANPAYEAAPALALPAGPRLDRSRRALLATAERPLVLAGGGVHISAAADALSAFATQFGIPGCPHHDGQGRPLLHPPSLGGLFSGATTASPTA